MRGRGNAGIPVVLRIDHRDGSISEVPIRDVAFSQIALDNAPADDDPRQDFQLAEPDGTEVEIQELDVQGRTIRIAKKPLARVDRDRPGVRRRHAARGGHVERGVRVEPAPDPLPVRRRSRRQQPRGLPRFAREVGDARADPHLRPLRGRPQHPGQLHVHPARVLPARRPRVGDTPDRPHRRRAGTGQPAARHGLVPPGRRRVPPDRAQQPPA